MSEESLRLDVWLWRVRAFKTRSLAMEFVKKKGVRITRAGQTRKISKPGTAVSIGDVVTYGRGEHIKSMEIRGFGTRRGPPSEAAELYSLIEDET